MPRLDNSDPEVQEAFDLSFSPDDPGATPPVDVCAPCAAGLGLPDEVAHPPYEELDYTCALCGAPLTENDN